MKINYKATNLELTEPIKNYVAEKLRHMEKFLNPAGEDATVQVELGRETKHHKHGDIFRAEINLHWAGRDLRAVSNQNNLYAAIDLAKDELAAEITAYRERKNTLLRRGGRAIKNWLRGFSRPA